MFGSKWNGAVLLLLALRVLSSALPALPCPTLPYPALVQWQCTSFSFGGARLHVAKQKWPDTAQTRLASVIAFDCRIEVIKSWLPIQIKLKLLWIYDHYLRSVELKREMYSCPTFLLSISILSMNNSNIYHFN
jgi:hypothetical protein